MKTLFIVNPVAGRRNGKEVIQTIHEKMGQSIHSYDIQVTTQKREAEVLARQGTEQGYKKIVAVGGDGTIYEVVNGIMGQDAILGVIPIGTGNDFVKSMGISQNIEDAIDIIKNGDTVQIDCGKVNDRYFINVASVGLDAEVVEQTEKIKGYVSGPWAYIGGLLKTLFTYKNKDIQMSIDGRYGNRKVTLVAVANGKYYGGGMKIAPTADMKDGDFQICIVDEVSKMKLMKVFPKIFSGHHVEYKEVSIHDGKHILINSSDKLSINLDGDIIDGDFQVHFQMVHKGIKVMAPRQYNLP